jgi:outer membrane receptor protein involved in Fe transport
VKFQIRAQSLADALDRFGEQCGLQIVYDDALLTGRTVQAVEGAMRPDDALNHLLAGTGLVWSYVNDQTVVVQRPIATAGAPHPTAAPVAQERPKPKHEAVTTLSSIEVREDPLRALPNEASASSFGFSKPLLETPRTVSVLSEETIDLFALSAVEDLVRVAPGVFTTTRFGIQGAVDVRNVPADTYFRGMKRLSLQGHGRSVLAAMDTIEIIGGPPSPIYGMGKIGGYTNLVPKSGRAKTGSYLKEVQGFAQGITGDYGRREVSFGVGGPLNVFDRYDRHGGYYVYGLVEDSDSYTIGVPVQQKLLQAAVSIDNFAGPLRLETGSNYQVSRTAGALTGRFTQDLVDTGRYIRGAPLVNLDANNNGAIGYLEMQSRSPVVGNLSMTNQPLIQTFAWPVDAQGHPYALDKIPKVSGIPAAMYQYLTAHPEADPTGVLRAQGVGGPVPTSGGVPLGMVLDPRTVGYDTLDLRRAGAFEKDLEAHYLTLFLDLIHDTDPNFTVKNQMFFDSMDQYKNSNQPYVQEQDVHVVEDKLTITRRFTQLPSWLRLNALVSVNLRNTVSSGKTTGNDFSSHRTDSMAPTWVDALGGMTPNTTFASPIENPGLTTDGYPWVDIYRSEFSEFGLGTLFDIDLWKTNLMLGARIDGSHAKHINYAGSFNATTGTSANPGAYLPRNDVADGWDQGVSWSISLSHELPYRIRPYVTWAKSSIVLDGNNNMLTIATVKAGHVGSADLKEIGVKASLFNDRLFFASSAYEQGRVDVDADDDISLVYAYATATKTRGWSTEIKYVPIANLFLSAYALAQVTRFDPNVGSTQLVDARTLGFTDVLDAQGNVIYPAEAFLYGGRSRILLPANMPEYEKKRGNPEVQYGLSSTYRWNSGFGVSLGGNYFDSTCTGRLCVVKLPASYVMNAGAFMDIGRWAVKLDVTNVLDERYFRARTGDTLGNVLAQVMPDRRWQLTVKAKF